MSTKPVSKPNCFLLLPFFTVFLVCLPGCGEKLPDGMPRLHKTSLVVTLDGRPEEGVMISLYNEDGSLPQWSLSGRTDSQGVAMLKAYGRYDGVPAGRYRVVCSKSIRKGEPEFPGAMTEEELQAYEQRINSLPVMELVPEIYSSVKTTPLELTVSGKKGRFSFDLATGNAAHVSR